MLRLIPVLCSLLYVSTCPVMSQPEWLVLGIAQDGGIPQAGCQKICCRDKSEPVYRTALALTDQASGKWWLFEATPDFREQLELFASATGRKFPYLPEGIFITHAHIGHYTGLMQLGREVMNSRGVKVYTLPRLKEFLSRNGPWSQLLGLGNIVPIELQDGTELILTPSIRVTPLTVPHRDEFSETAGFRIRTASVRYLFIPDIDKWSKWSLNIVEEVRASDQAYLDATFFSAAELPGRDMNEIPHPLVTETMSLFSKEPVEVRQRIRLIHLNHSNPLRFDPAVRQQAEAAGYRLAIQAEP